MNNEFSCGGVVYNIDNHEMIFLLLHYCSGHWDFPKGNREREENYIDTIRREIKEETGLQDVQLKKHLVTTWHTYDESGHHILKETAWYLLSAPKNQVFKPQTIEQITEIEWASPGHLEKYVSNSFPAILDVLKAAYPPCPPKGRETMC